jgi:hypothetical protein
MLFGCTMEKTLPLYLPKMQVAQRQACVELNRGLLAKLGEELL